MTFRSPLLQTYPTRSDPHRLLKLRQRSTWVATLFLLIGIPTALVWSRLPPADGWGYWLYKAHDLIYLPLKGNIYTRFLPLSMIALILVSGLLLAWLYFFVNNQSMVRPLHIGLLKVVLKLPAARPLLLRSARILADRGLYAHLMVEVLDHLRVRRLDGFGPTSSAKHAAELAQITLFQLRLMGLPGMAEDHPLKAVLAFEEVILILRKSLAKEQRGLLPKLAQAVVVFIPPLAEIRDVDTLKQEDPGWSPFSSRAFARDILALAALADSSLAPFLPGDLRMDLPALALEKGAAQQLALSSALRRSVLDNLRRYLEERHLLNRESALSALPLTPLRHLNKEQLADWGRLTLGLVMDRACLDNHPRSALTYIDSIEALRLAMALCSPESDPDEQELCLGFEQLLGRLPLPRHYRLCNQLVAAQLDNRLQQWQASSLERSDLVRATDFTMDYERLYDLAQAAGPDLLPSAGDGS